MPSFQDLFQKTAGKPVEYQGKTVVMFDKFPTEGVTTLRLVFEECNAEWRQGVSLCFDGKVEVNGETIKSGLVLWHDTAPHVVDLHISSDVKTIDVKNVWDVGDGVIHSWHNGAAMIVEAVARGRRYRCNDGLPDDDFDDIIFRLERE